MVRMQQDVLLVHGAVGEEERCLRGSNDGWWRCCCFSWREGTVSVRHVRRLPVWLRRFVSFWISSASRFLRRRHLFRKFRPVFLVFV